MRVREACTFGTEGYAQDYVRVDGVLLTVLVDPPDVVSVPTDSGAQKMRVCRYEVHGMVSTVNTNGSTLQLNGRDGDTRPVDFDDHLDDFDHDFDDVR